MVGTSLLAGCLTVSGCPPPADAASEDRSRTILFRTEPFPLPPQRNHTPRIKQESTATQRLGLCLLLTFLILPPDFFTISSSTMDCRQMLIMMA